MNRISAGDMFALAAVIFWGINYPMVKQILSTVPETQFLLIRFVCAFLLLLGYLVVTGENLRVQKEHWKRIFLLGLLGVGIYNIFWTYGIHRTTSANAALLIATSPIFSAIYAMAKKEETITKNKWVGILLAFFGIALIVSFSAGASFTLSSNSFVGDLLILFGAVLTAYYSIAAKPLLEIYSPAKLTTLTMGAGLMLLIPFAIINHPTFLIYTALTENLFSFGYVIVLGTVLAFVLWYKGVKLTSPVRAFVYHYLIPVISMVLGAFVFGERIQVVQVLGALLVFCGLALVKFAFKLPVKSKKV